MNQCGLLQPFQWWKDKQHISTSLKTAHNIEEGNETPLRTTLHWCEKKTVQGKQNEKTNQGLCIDPSTFVSLFRCICFIQKRRLKKHS